MNSHLNKLPLMMKDSLIIIRVRDRHFIRLIIIQDRIIRSTRFIRARLITTRARDRLTTLGTVTAAVTAAVMAAVMAEDMAEDMAEVTVTSRRISKWGQSSSPFFCFKNDNIMTNIGNDCDSVPLLLR